MNKKTYSLISGLLGTGATVANILVAYFQPDSYVAIMAAVGIGAKAVDEILLLFVKD